MDAVTHDPLCRNLNWTPWTEGARCPECDVIVRIRADERDNGWGNVLAKYRAGIEAEVRAQIVADIEALPCIIADHGSVIGHRCAIRTDDAARIARGTA